MTRIDKNTVFTEACEQLNSEGFNGIAKVVEMLMNAAMEMERAKAIGKVSPESRIKMASIVIGKPYQKALMVWHL